MEDIIPIGLLKTLKEKNNTIIKTNRVKNVIREKYNKEHNTNYDDMNFSLMWSQEEFDIMVKDYMNELSKLVGKPIEWTILPGIDAVATDCYLIKVVK